MNEKKSDLSLRIFCPTGASRREPTSNPSLSNITKSTKPYCLLTVPRYLRIQIWVSDEIISFGVAPWWIWTSRMRIFSRSSGSLAMIFALDFFSLNQNPRVLILEFKVDSKCPARFSLIPCSTLSMPKKEMDISIPRVKKAVINKLFKGLILI